MAGTPIKSNLICGECLEEMSKLEAGSIDMILTDPPYGTTACKWDSVIPFEPLWEQLKRIIRPRGAIVLFGSEPFSSLLRVSNVKMFKYDWYWRKTRPSGFVNAKLKPMKDIETISVFSTGATANGSSRNMHYYPQGTKDANIEWNRPKLYKGSDRGVSPIRKNHTLTKTIEKTDYPRQVLDFSNSNRNLLHPTQKPVALMEYLIKTYTNEGETVLDFTMGSGTTGVACKNLSRSFIGIEKDEDYFKIASERINAVLL